MSDQGICNVEQEIDRQEVQIVVDGLRELMEKVQNESLRGYLHATSEEVPGLGPADDKQRIEAA